MRGSPPARPFGVVVGGVARRCLLSTCSGGRCPGRAYGCFARAGVPPFFALTSAVFLSHTPRFYQRLGGVLRPAWNNIPDFLRGSAPGSIVLPTAKEPIRVISERRSQNDSRPIFDSILTASSAPAQAADHVSRRPGPYIVTSRPRSRDALLAATASRPHAVPATTNNPVSSKGLPEVITKAQLPA